MLRYTCGVLPLKQYRALLCCCTLVVSGGLSSAQMPKTVQVTIKVKDASGAVIPHARIRVIPIPEPRTPVMETGPTGELTVQLTPGGHALFTSAQGFKTDVRHIEVSASSAGTEIPVMLQVGSFGGPVVVLSEEEAAKWARRLSISAMPYRNEWQIEPTEFAAMPHIAIVLRNPQTGAAEHYSGVRISDLMILAGAPMDDDSVDIAMRTYFTANDEVFSLAEVKPGLHDGEILIADSLNGHPLDVADGPFMLIVSADKRRVRWVKKLQWIAVKTGGIPQGI